MIMIISQPVCLFFIFIIIIFYYSVNLIYLEFRQVFASKFTEEMMSFKCVQDIIKKYQN